MAEIQVADRPLLSLLSPALFFGANAQFRMDEVSNLML